MNATWRDRYRLINCCLSPLSVILTGLIVYDIAMPATERDDAIVTGKHFHTTRGSDSRVLEARGRYTYSEEVSGPVYRLAETGDTIRVSLTPIFSEWKTLELWREGKCLARDRGDELTIMGLFGLAFLLTTLAYMPDRILFSKLAVVIAIPVLNLVSALLWVRLLMKWLGYIEKT